MIFAHMGEEHLTTTSSSDNTSVIIIGLVVVALVIGLYYLNKPRAPKK